MIQPSYIRAMQLIELVAKAVRNSPEMLTRVRAIYAYSVEGQEAIFELAAVVAGYNPEIRKEAEALRNQLRDSMEFERLAGRVSVRFTHDVMGEDYIEGLSISEARRWILHKMEQAQPTGPIRWDDKGLVCEAETVWKDSPTDATEHIARARGEIIMRPVPDARGVR
jgi:hypothetical protein